MKALAPLICALVLAGCTTTPINDLPQPPASFVTARNNLVLSDATTAGQFEVLRRSGDTVGHLWCAAGEYARRVLEQPVAQSIYVVKPLSRSVRRPGAQSVVFTVRPEPSLVGFERPKGDYNRTVRRPGENMTTGAAYQGCQTLPPRFPLFWK